MAESSSDTQATLQYMCTILHDVVAGDGTNDFPVVHDLEAAIGLEVTGTGIQPDEAPNQANTQNIIPPRLMEKVVSLLLSLKSIPPTFKEAVNSLLSGAEDIPPHTRWILLGVFGSAIKFRADILIGHQIHYELGNSSNTTPALLSCGEAFGEFWPHIRDKTVITVMSAFVLLLIWHMELVYKVMIIVMLTGVPVYYIPDLWGKMSGVDVTCGMNKQPLFWVTTLSTIALFFIFGFLIIWPLVYLIQRYTSPERSRGTELE